MALHGMQMQPSNENSVSHTGFRLILISLTLNDLERRNGCYFFSHNLIAMLANYDAVVEDRLIMK